MSKLTHLAISLGLLAGTLSIAQAQIPQGNIYFGLGTATADSSHQSLDVFGTGVPANTPKLNGLFADVGGSLMLTSHFGAGAQVSWRAGQGNYAGVNYRPIFYDFNGVWQPVKTKHIIPELQAGLGGVRVGFNANSTQCDALAGCQNVNLGSESSSHFAAHFAAAARVYVTPHIFLRPAVDAHWVNNFFQFGSNWVPEYGASIGWRFGER